MRMEFLVNLRAGRFVIGLVIPDDISNASPKDLLDSLAKRVAIWGAEITSRVIIEPVLHKELQVDAKYSDRYQACVTFISLSVEGTTAAPGSTMTHLGSVCVESTYT